MAKVGEMISTEEAREILNAVESASNGYWFPLVTVVTCFGIIILLLLYIWNQSQKRNELRHNESEKLLKQLTHNETDLKMLIISIKSDVNHNKEAIKELKT